MAEGRKREMIGRVTSDKMDKTIVVEVRRRVMNVQYGKYVQQRRKYKAHDEKNECRVGDKVEIKESRPLSREKRWILTRIVVRAEEA